MLDFSNTMYYIHECLVHTVTGLKALVVLTLSSMEETCKWINCIYLMILSKVVQVRGLLVLELILFIDLLAFFKDLKSESLVLEI